MERVIKSLLVFGGIYLFFDGLLHFLNIRLESVLNIWPQSAIAYAKLLNFIYGSFVFLASAICFILQKDLKKYQSFILISAVWALFHGFLLITLSLTQNYIQVFKSYPSLSVWSSFYDKYLILEGSLLIVYSLLVFIWIRGEKNGRD